MRSRGSPPLSWVRGELGVTGRRALHPPWRILERAALMTTEPAQQPDFVTLYRRAFAQYGALALWNMRSFEAPTLEDALVVARALRIEGNLQARRLAEQIEQVCRAAI
jgi:hypothetical protein